MRRLASLLLLLLAVAGCGEEERADPRPVASASATPTPTAEPDRRPPAVAYRLTRKAAASLDREDAFAVVEAGEVVARSELKAFPAIMLMERAGGFDVPDDLLPAVERVAAEQDLPLLVVAPEHRRHARALARVAARDEPTREWRRIVRRALARVDERHVVLIPVLD